VLYFLINEDIKLENTGTTQRIKIIRIRIIENKPTMWKKEENKLKTRIMNATS